jgi:D-glycero-alpha-D-manno-heptose-7-phosphate kinase
MIISRTPLRIEFLGEGTDLPGFCNKEKGIVINSSIKKYVYIVVHPSFDCRNLISYSKIEREEKVDNIQNSRVREAMKMTGITKGVEIHSIAEVPSGTGLGSSSSFTVGLLNALYAYQGKHVSPERLAREACEIEIKILKEPIGRQDQYAAAYGGINKLEFNRDDVRITPWVIDKTAKEYLKNHLMLFYLGGQRNASDILSEQNEMKKGDEIFNAYKEIRDIAEEAGNKISSGDISGFGKYLGLSWSAKKRLKGVTTKEIDNYYNLAVNCGAEGGKLLGAGGTGFLLLYAEPEKQEQIRIALHNLREMELDFDNEGSKIVYMAD